MVLQQSLLLALMSPSTHTTVGMMSCPSGDVSELLLMPYNAKWFILEYSCHLLDPSLLEGSISPTWSHRRSLPVKSGVIARNCLNLHLLSSIVVICKTHGTHVIALFTVTSITYVSVIKSILHLLCLSQQAALRDDKRLPQIHTRRLNTMNLWLFFWQPAICLSLIF